MQILLSPEAEHDLIEIFDYIINENPKAAEKILNLIIDEIHYLSEHPYLGKPGRVPGTRELVISGTPFIVPYQVSDNNLEILRVFHTSRKWPEGFQG